MGFSEKEDLNKLNKLIRPIPTRSWMEEIVELERATKGQEHYVEILQERIAHKRHYRKKNSYTRGRLPKMRSYKGNPKIYLLRMLLNKEIMEAAKLKL